MYQSALLLLSGPMRLAIESIGQYLKWTNKKVVKCLYVKLEPDLNKPFAKSDSSNLRRLASAAPIVYSKASTLCKNIDVRLILGSNRLNCQDRNTVLNFDAILTNNTEIKAVSKYLDEHFGSSCDEIVTINDISRNGDEKQETGEDFAVFRTVCLGGTFDRLHNGHKVLLSEAVLRATDKLIVGVSTGSSLKRKILWELIEPVEKRIEDVTNFLTAVDPSLHYEVASITDVYGPTITEPDMDCLVVTTETKVGGIKVNEERNKRGMKEMVLQVVDLVENTEHTKDEEEKLSSSTNRMHLLGMPLKQQKPSFHNDKSYRILLRGNPVSGKANIGAIFQALGIPVLCCDGILETMLNKDDSFIENFKREFSDDFPISTNGTVDFGSLVTACLRTKEKRNWLAQCQYPKLKSTLQQVVQVYEKQSSNIIIIKDSDLFEDYNLDIGIDEVWAAILPSSDSITLLKEQHNLEEMEALQVTESFPNEKYVECANILFCNKWSIDSLQTQVNKAYTYLKSG